jgi:hypothetical protein
MPSSWWGKYEKPFHRGRILKDIFDLDVTWKDSRGLKAKNKNRASPFSIFSLGMFKFTIFVVL